MHVGWNDGLAIGERIDTFGMVKHVKVTTVVAVWRPIYYENIDRLASGVTE